MAGIPNTCIHLTDTQLDSQIALKLSKEECERIETICKFYIPYISIEIDDCKFEQNDIAPTIYFHDVKKNQNGEESVRRDTIVINKGHLNIIERLIAQRICIYHLDIYSIEDETSRNLVQEKWIRLLVPKIKVDYRLLSFLSEFHNHKLNDKRTCPRCKNPKSNLYESWYYNHKGDIMCYMCNYTLLVENK